ncbi:MAG TPA: 3-hydroxyacyl-CoA dehydrogenase family protein [Kofleriaceae bacterium]|nr:3-hydroxyacyl-CoA dehydrogenase family protein [Kofleriaceae bacterium]
MQISSIAVIGTGTMGRGIAQVAAQSGFTVVVCDVDQATTVAGLVKIRSSLDRAVERGKLDADTRAAANARLSSAPDPAQAAARVDLVVEAVPEQLELKQRTLAAAVTGARPGVLVASNTSSLSIAAIAAALPDPSRVIGMHFFNPVPAMKLVEIVHHAGSAPEAVAEARSVAVRMGKTAIVVRDAPGFASSRLGIALGMEAIRMLEEEIATAADIDTAMRLGYGHPMGPLELTDLVGLDVRLAIAEYLAERLGDRFRPPELLRRKVAAGELGQKSGHGFYRWQDGKRVG